MRSWSRSLLHAVHHVLPTVVNNLEDVSRSDQSRQQMQQTQQHVAHHLIPCQAQPGRQLPAHRPAKQATQPALAWDLPRFLPAAGAAGTSSSLLSSWI